MTINENYFKIILDSIDDKAILCGKEFVMMGVNITNLESLIKRNNLYLDSYNKNSSKVIGEINELNSCFDGNSINFLKNKISQEPSNIRKISNIIQNYSDTLYQVKIGYQRQDASIATQLNHKNSQMQ